jgi:hypothetical protein
MSGDPVGQILPGLWRFEAVHPEWTEEEGGEDGWEPSVAWWALSLPRGVVLIDPLVEDWDGLDQLTESHGGCLGLVRTCHWHQRSIAEAADRYGAEVWAKRHPDEAAAAAFDHAVRDREEPFEGLVAVDVERTAEIALWLPTQKAIVFGDAMLRTGAGELRVCPESWTQPAGGRARLLSLLGQLTDLPVEHVLVSHGPLVLGDGGSALHAALP